MANKANDDKPQWLQDIPGKIEGFSDVNLDGLWDGIEQGLDSQKKVVPLPFMHRYAKAVAGAAAFITVAAAALAIFVLPDKNAPKFDRVDAVTPVVAQNDNAEPESIEEQLQGSSLPLASAYVPSAQVPSGKGTRSFSNPSLATTDHESAHEEARMMVGETAGGPDIATGSETGLASLYSKQVEYQAMEADNDKVNPSKTISQADEQSHHDEDYWAALENEQRMADANYTRSFQRRRFSLSAGGSYGVETGAMISSGDYATQPVQAPVMTKDATILMFSPDDMKAVKTVDNSVGDYDWSVASSLGAILSWYPSSLLPVSLSSGLMYTRLDGTSKTDSMHQNAGYLGIPLRVNYSFLNKDRMNLSASAGGRLDYCINTPDHAEINKIQSSAYVGLSADYMFSKNIGLRFGLGSDIYFVGRDKEKSPFQKTTPVGSASAAILIALP